MKNDQSRTENVYKIGYLHPSYARSLDEFGEPVELPRSGGWILKRPIPGTPYLDGMGCYPIFACQDWSGLKKDLDQLESQLVSLSLVTDPFGHYTHQELLLSFRDVAKPYKEHFVVDLKQPRAEFVASHHKRNALKALQNVRIEVCMNPIQFLDEWCTLYDNLIERHRIKGIATFSHRSFVGQLSLPGMIAFRATTGEKTVGMILWVVQNKIAYYHLGAYSPEGYELKASFALFWKLLEYFQYSGLDWLSLGAGAGVQGDENDGLSRFKRGWATGTRMSFFCGRIFDAGKYNEIIPAHRITDTNYFPVYRAGEFR